MEKEFKIMKNLFLSLFVLLCIGCTTVEATAQIDDCVEVYTEVDMARLGVPTYHNNVIIYYTLGGYRYYPYFVNGYRYYRYYPRYRSRYYGRRVNPPYPHRPQISRPQPQPRPLTPQTRPNVGRPNTPQTRPNVVPQTRPNANRVVTPQARPNVVRPNSTQTRPSSTFSGGSRRGR